MRVVGVAGEAGSSAVVDGDDVVDVADAGGGDDVVVVVQVLTLGTTATPSFASRPHAASDTIARNHNVRLIDSALTQVSSSTCNAPNVSATTTAAANAACAPVADTHRRSDGPARGVGVDVVHAAGFTRATCNWSITMRRCLDQWRIAITVGRRRRVILPTFDRGLDSGRIVRVG